MPSAARPRRGADVLGDAAAAPAVQRIGPSPRRRRDDPPPGGPRRVDVAMRLLPEQPPPGPSEEDFWTSPLRGPWLTAILGSILLVLMVVVGLTGFLSHAAYNPDLGRNAIVPPDH